MHRPLALAGLALALSAPLAGCDADRALASEAGLQRFTDCGQLRMYVADVMLETMLAYRYGGWGYWGLDGAAEDSAGGGDGPSDYTTTNVQEAGVDEIDLVKTDGYYLYVGQDKAFHVVDSWPTEDAERVSTLEVDGWIRGLFLRDDTVVLLSWVHDDDGFLDGWYGTRIQVIDVTDRADPEVVRTVDVEGWLADGRMIGEDVYLVLNHWTWLPSEAWDLAYDEDLDLPEVDWSLEGEELEEAIDEAREEARAILEPEVEALALGMDLDQVLPSWRDQWADAPDASPERMHACGDVYRPSQVSQLNVLSLVHLDLDSDALDATGVLSDGWHVYASQDDLYVAQTSWGWWWGWGDLDMQTHIHKFELDPDAEPEYVASGAVSGWVYDQFAMSEHDGHLRVATTDTDWWWWTGTEDEGGNNLFVLRDDGAGSLDTVGSVTGIAPGEQIQATRMMGDTAYMVTYERIDPLWTLDLSDPTDPELVGELEMPGFSAYLHPLGDDHLLAVGMDGEDDGTLTGVAVNVFDVSDLSAPSLAHQYTIESDGWSWSEAMWDHHAFTFHKGVLSIPAYHYAWDEASGEYDYFSGLYVFEVEADSGISPLGTVDHRDLVEDSECLYSRWYDGYDDSACEEYGWWYAQVRRSVYIEDELFSVSDYGIKVNDLWAPADEIARVLFYPAE